MLLYASAIQGKDDGPSFSGHWRYVFSTVCYDLLTEARLDVNWNSRQNLMLLLRAEGYLQIDRVNMVTSAKISGFEHCAQRVTFSSSTTELPLWLWLYYPGGSMYYCTPTRPELVRFQDQRKFPFSPRTVHVYLLVMFGRVSCGITPKTGKKNWNLKNAYSSTCSNYEIGTSFVY